MSTDLNMTERKPRIAVISPFLDKQHATERCVAEQLERLATEYEFHVYSTRIADMDLREITWHRIPTIPGPYLFKYIWFFCANQFWRWLGVSGARDFDLTYSPGINCLDADLISVHVIFGKFYKSVRESLSFSKNPPSFWPRLLHRRLSYLLLIFLERRVYTRRNLPLITISRKSSGDLCALYHRANGVLEMYYGIDGRKFSPGVRDDLRRESRNRVGYAERDFVLLLIGNDWNNKGLRCLLEAAEIVGELRLKIAIVGTDDPAPYHSLLKRNDLGSRVAFLPPRSDPEFYYAMADAYVGPSREDAFGLPPLEAMACGLPVIVSQRAGVSEVVKDGEDGLILEDPEDAEELAILIRRLCENEELRREMGRKAADTSRQYTWQRNAEELSGIFRHLLDKRQTQPVPISRLI
jgi:glycosyltransferase involved in cell wall biosynthesis